jgi:hypothetical protein
MTLEEMKKKVLGLIEELNPKSDLLTDDPDIATKINAVINQIQYELARMKKIASYIEIPVEAGTMLTFEDIEKESGYVVYQLDIVRGIDYEMKAQGTIIKVLESGVAEIEFFRYPELITEKTKDKGYEFELSQDVLEVMPYGIASDLLKSDVSANYGEVYTNRYETMLNRLDHRYSMPRISIDGGIDI